MPDTPTLPLITIATVTYNPGALLERTISSVEEQTYPHVEHLIVDGNSQDGTLAAVHRYQERNSVARIRHDIVCRSEPDKGLYDAMNKALNLASGQYILFINAGDRLHSARTLEELAGAISRQKVAPAVVYGHTDLVDAQGHFLRHRRLAPPQRLSWRSFSRGMLVCHQAFMARTDLARQTPYDQTYRFSADFDWCIRLMKRAQQLSLPLLNARMVVADYLSEGLTTRNHRASLKERFRIMTRHYGWPATVALHAWFVVRAAVRR